MEYDKVYDQNDTQIYKIDERVYFRQTQWDPSQQCNGGYLLLEDGIAMVDAPGIAGTEQMLDEIRELFGKPLRYLFLTHGHWDHADGLPLLFDMDITVVLTRQAHDRLLREGKSLPKRRVIVDRSLGMRLDGLSIECFAYDGTLHSGEDLYISLPKDGYLFTGDTVASFLHLYFVNADLERWTQCLDLLKARGDQLLLCGHGPLREPDYYDEVKAYFLALQSCLADVRAQAGGSVRGIESGTLDRLILDAAASQQTAPVDICAKHLHELLDREVS